MEATLVSRTVQVVEDAYILGSRSSTRAFFPPLSAGKLQGPARLARVAARKFEWQKPQLGKGKGESGAGGGRILPGVRVNSYNYGSYGGAANEAGQNGGSGGHSGASGGGGGWGAAGGRGYRGAFTSSQCQGGSAGAAIAGTSRTLSNSDTIYGAT